MEVSSGEMQNTHEGSISKVLATQSTTAFLSTVQSFGRHSSLKAAYSEFRYVLGEQVG